VRAVDRWIALRYPIRRATAAIKVKYLLDFVFVHINKTGGSSVERALGIPFQHRTAVELRDHLGTRRWESRFSFTFVRNPWDKVSSHYHYRVKTNQTELGRHPIPFAEWVVRAYGERDPRYVDQPRMFMPQVDWISDADGRIMVDFVGRFERLRSDFDEVCRRLDLRDRSLPHVKRSGQDDYRRLYDAEARRVVEDRFAPDIERFGYGFE